MNHPSVITTTIDGVPAFETKDLMQRHPEDPSLWCVYGRADDQLMLSTGEKVCGAKSPVDWAARSRSVTDIPLLCRQTQAR